MRLLSSLLVLSLQVPLVHADRGRAASPRSRANGPGTKSKILGVVHVVGEDGTLLRQVVHSTDRAAAADPPRASRRTERPRQSTAFDVVDEPHAMPAVRVDRGVLGTYEPDTPRRLPDGSKVTVFRLFDPKGNEVRGPVATRMRFDGRRRITRTRRDAAARKLMAGFAEELADLLGGTAAELATPSAPRGPISRRVRVTDARGLTSDEVTLRDDPDDPSRIEVIVQTKVGEERFLYPRAYLMKAVQAMTSDDERAPIQFDDGAIIVPLSRADLAPFMTEPSIPTRSGESTQDVTGEDRTAASPIQRPYSIEHMKALEISATGELRKPDVSLHSDTASDNVVVTIRGVTHWYPRAALAARARAHAGSSPFIELDLVAGKLRLPHGQVRAFLAATSLPGETGE